MHMLAARGFNVVAVDSRGSKHRGRAWEAAIRGKLGQVELDDQVRRSVPTVRGVLQKSYCSVCRVVK